MKSKVEIDFKRLLSKCQKLVLLNPNSNWRLEKYVVTLEQMLEQLHKLPTGKPSREELNEFNKQINYFKGLIHVDKLKSPSEKLMATQILSPNVSLMNDTNVHSNSDFYLHSQAIYTKEIRDELFKKENKFVEKPKEEDLSTILKEHEKKQEKFSENMVLLARNLKQNLMTANTIIKNDTMTLEKASNLADKNKNSLKSNNDRLSDFVKRSCQYWLWIIAALVSITFIMFVLFIKVFPKKIYA